MKKIELNISRDFSEFPGTRKKSTSDNSGEELYESLLRNKFKNAIDKNTKLSIDFDGTAGCPSSFLDEAFGRLSLEFGYEKCVETLEIISKEQLDLKNDIDNSMREWDKHGVHHNSNR